MLPRVPPDSGPAETRHVLQVPLSQAHESVLSKVTEQRQAQSTPTPEDTTPPTVTPRAPAKGRTVPQRHVRALAPVPVRATVFGRGKRGLGGRDWLRAAREDGGPEGRPHGRTVAPR